MEKNNTSPTHLLRRLQRICSRSEKCPSDIRRKLAEWGVPTHEADGFLTHLQAQGFVDVARYARAFVRDKHRLEHWGARKIKAALQAKKIPEDTITEALREIDNTQSLHTLIRLLQRKNATLRTTSDIELKIKLWQFALRKGYDAKDIGAAMHAVMPKR
ncbi:MAG: RecX family transcriptional regulator [Prevotellaceae bacterium]|jgi:regulatory protein|nr:RecX family transcriptional regulator [Prevotellaceae bacterium]